MAINKKKVLLVDDNLFMLKIMAMMLESENLEFTLANDGQEALNIITNEPKEKFDIVITDYQMPIVNGQELAEALRKHDEYKNIPIVLITQATHISYESDEKHRVFDEIFYKPISRDYIIKIKNNFLEMNEDK